VGLLEAPHLHDLKQNHSKNAKSWKSKHEFFFKNQPSSSLWKNFLNVAFCLQKDNKTEPFGRQKTSYNYKVSRICKIDYW
jgi:hypothetical protein